MKKIQHLIYAILILVTTGLFSCKADDDGFEEFGPLPEGTPFEVTFGGFADGMSVATVRASGDDPNQITNLRLLVFDENHHFLYSRKVVLGGNIAAPTDNQAYLPDNKKNGISTVKSFTVNLLSSSKKRYIHFIANHDWKGFQQDYFLEGKDEGQLIGGMRTQQNEFWRMIEFSQLQQSNFNGKVFKLLRNNAKVSVACNADNFTYEGFTVYNAYDKSSVAPFIFNDDLTYIFPSSPDKPTVPADVQKLTPKSIDVYSDGIDVFERYNTDDTPLFVILKGQLSGKREGYYKIAMKKFDATTGVSALLNIIRNCHYKITVSSVANEGYPTAEEAASKPSGNNLFASVEMADYPSVSDGTSIFSVSKLGGVVTAVSTFTTDVFYTNGIDNVKGYPSWTNDEYIESWSLVRDPGDPTKKKGILTVKFKKIPTDRTLQFDLNLVARPNQTSTANIITRKAKFFLRPPYLFKPELSSNGVLAGSKVTLSFEVPRTIPKTAFPFDVYIETKELTPDLELGLNNNMILEVKNGKYYYKYTVKDISTTGTTTDLHFIRNNDDAIEKIKLISEYYQPDQVQLGNYDIVDGELKYGPSQNQQNVPYTAPIEVFYDGQIITSSSMIKFEMIDYKGHYNLQVDKSVDKSKNLRIRYNQIVTNSSGSVTYNNEKTMTVQQWLDSPNQTLGRLKIIIKGFITYYSSYYNEYNYIATPSSLNVNVGTLSGVVKNDNTYSKFTLTIPGSANQYYIRFSYYNYLSDKTLADLERNLTIVMRE